MTTNNSDASKNSTKRAIKRKLDDSILKKAREALGLPLENPDDNDGEKQNDEPSLKWRKPRHNTAEGQLYMKNKEKRRQEEEEQSRLSQSVSRLTSKKDDKKRKKKHKSKKKNKTDGASATVEKNPEGVKRHEMEAIAYLQLWTANRDHWKFEKRKQTWLLQNCLNDKLIDENRFELLLEYIASIKGAARQATCNEMQSIVERREATGKNSELMSSADTVDTPKGNEISDVMYQRARQIIQMLTD